MSKNKIAPMKIKAVLFDMDGVLLDSEEFITRAGMKMFREKGYDVKYEDFKEFTGMGENRFNEIGFSEYNFDATINGLEVEHKKPDPEIFIKAAEKLGVNAGSCLVAEDAVSGVKAAKAAGCKCLALTTSFNAGDFPEADWVSNTLADAPKECLER